MRRLPAGKANRFLARYVPSTKGLTVVDRMFLAPHVCQPDGIGRGLKVGPGDGLDHQADSLHKIAKAARVHNKIDNEYK